MPFFTYSVDPTAWLLPIARGILSINFLVFRFLEIVAPIGIPIVVAIVLGLFSRNLMKPAEA